MNHRLLREGKRLAARGQPHEALEVLREAVVDDPEHGNAWLHLGVIALYSGEIETAHEALHASRDLLDETAFPSCALGALYFDIGEYDAARGVLAHAEAHFPAYGLAAWLLALLDWKDGDLQQARERVSRAPEVHIRLLDGRLLCCIEETLIARWSPESPDPNVLIGEPSCSPLRFGPVEALARGLSYLYYPFHPQKRRLRNLSLQAHTALDQHRFKQGVAALEEAHRLAPDEEIVQLQLAEAYLLSGLAELAWETATAIDLPDGSPAQREVDTIRGVAAYCMGEPEKAEELLAPLGPLPPPQLAYYRGLARLRSDDRPGASRDLLIYTSAIPPRRLRERMELCFPQT